LQLTVQLLVKNSEQKPRLQSSTQLLVIARQSRSLFKISIHYFKTILISKDHGDYK